MKTKSRARRLCSFSRLAILPLLCACDATNLYVGHRTIVGMNAAVNNDQTTGHLIIGYDRKFGAVVPVSVPVAKPDGTISDAHDAMSVLSCSELNIDGIFLSGFKEYLATGQAARNFVTALKEAKQSGNANRVVAFKEIFDCYQDKPVAGSGSGATGAGSGSGSGSTATQ